MFNRFINLLTVWFCLFECKPLFESKPLVECWNWKRLFFLLKKSFPVSRPFSHLEMKNGTRNFFFPVPESDHDHYHHHYHSGWEDRSVGFFLSHDKSWFYLDLFTAIFLISLAWHWNVGQNFFEICCPWLAWLKKWPDLGFIDDKVFTEGSSFVIRIQWLVNLS